MKTLKVIFLAQTLFLQGCLLLTQTASVKIKNKEKVKRDCEILAATSDYLSLRNQIWRDTEEIIRLTGETNPVPYLPRMTKLNDRIRVNVSQLKEKLSPEWNEARWDSEAVWNIVHNQNNPNLVRVEIEKIFMNGEERVDLKKQIKILKSAYGVKIQLKTKASSLEVCEFQKTIGLLVKLTFGSVIKSTQYYRLFIEEGN